ncbi:hypothetical protein FOZ60_000514 [Perkinsus olseni]|uniref:Uncharacterized protein n=1 Tax=Perkinsus olseni TaxID=32597 RepID=A0A7J6N024_PEROL|nr:hypothetical protein FOZ60_000514 [Perkinsus olseni]
MPASPPPRTSQSIVDEAGDGSAEERRTRRPPIDISVDITSSTSALLEWIVAATDTFASRKSVWSKAAAESLETQSKKDSELLHIYLELANERKKMVEIKSEIDETRRAVASSGSKKRRASVDSEIFRSIQESDCVSAHSINSSSSRNDVPEEPIPSLPAIASAAGGTGRVSSTTGRPVVPTTAVTSDAESTETAGWRLAAPRRRGRQRGQRAANHPTTTPTPVSNPTTRPPGPPVSESTILCVTLRGKVEPTGRWENLSADELETVRTAASRLLNGVRVTRTFAVGGGLGLLLPDRRQWTAAVGMIGRDPNLICKEILRSTSTIKILFPRGASELSSYSGQFLLNDLGKKNGIDTSRITVIKQTQAFAVVRGPSSALARFAAEGRLFLGLASRKAGTPLVLHQRDVSVAEAAIA